MTQRRPDDIRRAIDGELSGVERDPFLYQRVLNMAGEQPQPRPRRVSRRLTVALVVMAALMLSTAAAVAGNWLSVRWFLTDRLWTPHRVEDTAIAHPASQSCDSEWLNVTVMDAYWYEYGDQGDCLAVTMHLDVKDPEIAFCFETDIGKDGESFDMIWWNRHIMPVMEWLAGRECVEASLGSDGEPERVRINDWGCLTGWDYVHEEQGITLMIEAKNVPDLSGGATVTVALAAVKRVPDATNTYLVQSDEREQIALTFDLPPMRKGPPFSFEDYE